MKLRDVDLAASSHYPSASDFNRTTQWLASLYLDCLGGADAGSIAKVFVEVVPNDSTPQVRKIGQVAEVRICADVSEYQLLPATEKKRVALELLDRGMMAAASHFGWSPEPFQRARACVEQREYRNTKLWDRPKWNPGRTLRAQILYDFDSDGISVWALVWDRTGSEIFRRRLLQLPPHDHSLVEALGRFHWIDESRCQLVDRNGGANWIASVVTD